MRRGDVVTVAATGDHGQQRPAVIVQTDALPAEHASVVVCQMTSDGGDAQDFRVALEPSTRNGLRTRSHVMAVSAQVTAFWRTSVCCGMGGDDGLRFHGSIAS